MVALAPCCGPATAHTATVPCVWFWMNLGSQTKFGKALHLLVHVLVLWWQLVVRVVRFAVRLCLYTIGLYAPGG